MIQNTESGSFHSAEADNDLPPELAEELIAMNSFSDKALWKTAHSHLSVKEAQKLRQLNHKQQKYGQTSLTQLERQTLEELGYQYDRSILLRSQAMWLLKVRGHDLTKVLKASSKTSIITNSLHKTSITPLTLNLSIYALP